MIIQVINTYGTSGFSQGFAITRISNPTWTVVQNGSTLEALSKTAHDTLVSGFFIGAGPMATIFFDGIELTLDTGVTTGEELMYILGAFANLFGAPQKLELISKAYLTGLPGGTTLDQQDYGTT